MDEFYGLLDRQTVYWCAQALPLPGQYRLLVQTFKAIVEGLPRPLHVLDVGCDSSFRSECAGPPPVGLDVTPSYAARYRSEGGVAVVASSVKMPFSDGVFDQTRCLGLLHHLSDSHARKTGSR